jgi:phage shock protein A
VSGLGDALKAIKKAILLEERITSQSKKLEQLAQNVVEMDKRLSALEGRMEGFMAAASAFGSGARRSAKLVEAVPKERPGLPPGQEN